MATTPLLIYDAPETIRCAQAIFDFIILAQYVLYDNEMLCYMEHAFYRLEKTKIAFEYHRPINSKLYQPNFNYFKFHTISHLVQCIWDYGSVVNYDTAYSKAAQKYLPKAFYNKQIKKSTTCKFSNITYAILI